MPKIRQGSLFVRGKSKVYYLDYRMEGKRFVKCLGTSDPEKAEAERQRIIYPLALEDRKTRLLRLKAEIESLDEELSVEHEKQVVEEKTILLEHAWGEYLRNPYRPNAGDRTLTEYLRQCDAFEDWARELGYKTMQSITRDVAARYLAHMDQSAKKAGTINKHFNLLKLVWKTLLPDSSNPFDGLRSRKVSSKNTKRALTTKELKAIIKKTTDREQNLLVKIGYYTGLRLYDAVHLNMDMVIDGVLHVSPRKTMRRQPDKKLTIPLHADLEKALPKAGSATPQLMELYAKDDSAVSKKIKRAMKAAGVVDTVAGSVGMHALRHTFQTRLDEAKIPRYVSGAITGHVSGSMGDIYGHVGIQEMKAAINKLPSIV